MRPPRTLICRDGIILIYISFLRADTKSWIASGGRLHQRWWTHLEWCNMLVLAMCRLCTSYTQGTRVQDPYKYSSDRDGIGGTVDVVAGWHWTNIGIPVTSTSTKVEESNMSDLKSSNPSSSSVPLYTDDGSAGRQFSKFKIKAVVVAEIPDKMFVLRLHESAPTDFPAPASMRHAIRCR